MLRHFPRIGAIAVICGLVALVVVCMVALLNPRSLAGVISRGWSPTAAPAQAPGELGPLRPSAALPPDVPTPIAALDVQPFAPALDTATAVTLPAAAIADRPGAAAPTPTPVATGEASAPPAADAPTAAPPSGSD